jgi:DNA-binding beta-propeller fold protein YncE
MMPTRKWIPFFCLVVLVPGFSRLASLAWADASGTYQVVNTFKIGGAGGFDYAKMDDDGKLLFLPRTGHTQVIDTSDGHIAADIVGGGRLHGTAVAPDAGHGFITDGTAGAVIVFDLKTFAVLGTIPAAEDADGIIYDSASNHVLVACGDAGALVPIAADVDPKTGKADAKIDLGGKPEFLTADGQGKVFVNLADKAQLAVVDTKTMTVIAKYPTTPGTTPTGLAMDREKGRLYIGCRNQKMIVMDAKDGTILADLPIGRGVDATAFHDGTAFASCVEGTLAVIRETSPGKFEVVQTLDTAVGAKTMAVSLPTGAIYLPTADMAPTTRPGARPQAIPGTFKVIVVEKANKP